MDGSLDITRRAVEEFLRFALITARVSGLFLVAPVWGGGGVPRRVKVALAAMVALVLLPVVPRGNPAALIDGGLLQYLAAVGGELLVGTALGLVAAMVLAGIELGGLFVGRQTGLALANVIDPSSGNQVSVMGRFYRFLALVVFLGVGGHRMLVMALCRSYEVAPLGAVALNASRVAGSGELAAALVGAAGRMFTIGLAVAAPVVVTLVVTTIALGLIARTVPQMNILVVGFPVRILLGWLVTLISIGAVAVLAVDLFERMFGDLLGLVELF